jgi:hypothetical protein
LLDCAISCGSLIHVAAVASYGPGDRFGLNHCHQIGKRLVCLTLPRLKLGNSDPQLGDRQPSVVILSNLLPMFQVRTLAEIRAENDPQRRSAGRTRATPRCCMQQNFRRE